MSLAPIVEVRRDFIQEVVASTAHAIATEKDAGDSAVEGGRKTATESPARETALATHDQRCHAILAVV